MSLRHNAEASDQLAVGKLFRQGGGEPHVDLEIVDVVLDQAVPSAIYTGPINLLTAKALHVRVAAQHGFRGTFCVIFVGIRA